MGKKAKKVTIKEAKKGGAGTMAQTAEEKRKQEQDELQKQQQDLDPEEVDDEETSQGDDDSAKDQEDEEEKTPFIQRVRDLAVKVLKILIKWVLKPLAIAIVVFASMISLIVNLGGKVQQQDEGDNTDSDDPGEEDAPEEEFEDDSDSDEGEAE